MPNEGRARRDPEVDPSEPIEGAATGDTLASESQQPVAPVRRSPEREPQRGSLEKVSFEPNSRALIARERPVRNGSRSLAPKTHAGGLSELAECSADAAPWVELTSVERSAWNERFLVRLRDGARVECVLYRGDTLCISSQVGCAVRCPFCASGQSGLARGLELAELVGQVEAVRARGCELARVTVSGVGEPLHNHRIVTELLECCSRQRLGMSLTTSGGPLPRLREWLHAPHNGLTLSVHAGTPATRARLVPNGPALEPLFEVLRDELPRMTRRRRKKTALAYLLIEGANDAGAELDAFIARAAPLALRVHLYQYNPVADLGYARVSRARYEAAYAQLTAAGLRVSMSSRARIEANGGCGTLVALRRAEQ